MNWIPPLKATETFAGRASASDGSGTCRRTWPYLNQVDKMEVQRNVIYRLE
jgi:hypothetical protein